MTQSSLFEKLKHPNPHLRDRAMWEIVETCDETTIPNLMEVLAEEDTVYRRAAVKVLGAIGIDTVPSLVDSLLNSDNSTIRGSCAKALAQVATNHKNVPFPSDGIEGLKKGLNDANPVVYIASAMALGVIGKPALDSLLEVLDGTDNPALAVAILNAVSSIDDDRSRKILSKFKNDKSADTYVQETANSAESRVDMLKFKSNPS
ncbi:MAG: HEAT repeat domain-containing protein [Okeania sp. SIO3H1]|uniref:HEAT repeat domain-containing protein n=1 Tax=Okeania sp. SIO1I7 TaxID=2607772 RepID=UPI0013C61504|nr:HEAT repeat domain-containing protein [Okeania sp. SIO1I7]NEN90486.1 HEAT repeat domain-containing protein [Okeania sp. SIO3H1]NET28032.1 HEAT repeat domain-containing protein [Okeania sp. SIO1I7]